MNLLIGLLPPIISNSSFHGVRENGSRSRGGLRHAKSLFLGACRQFTCSVWLMKSFSLSLNATSYTHTPVLTAPHVPWAPAMRPGGRGLIWSFQAWTLPLARPRFCCFLALGPQKSTALLKASVSSPVKWGLPQHLVLQG